MDNYLISIIVYIILSLIILIAFYKIHKINERLDKTIETLELIRSASAELALSYLDIVKYIDEIQKAIKNYNEKNF